MGRLDVDAMLREMTAGQLAGWEAYFSVEPWGPAIEDHRAGVIAATIANVAGKQIRAGHSLAPADFFPSRFPPPRTTKTFDEQVRELFGNPEDW